MSSYTVILDYDPVWAPLDWAKKHCPSYITNRAIVEEIDRGFYSRNIVHQIEYIFSDDRDAVWFTLRWA